MTRRVAVALVAFGGLVSVGCSSMNHTERGVLGGGAGGAAVGALIGNASGNTGAGAAIGGVTGAVLGGLVGNDADRRDERVEDVKLAAATQAYLNDQPARITEVVELARTGNGDDIILNYIRTNRMTFRLSVDDINTLKTNGVSAKVIAAMQNTGELALSAPPKPVVVRERVVVEPVYVHRPPPPVVVYDPWCGPPPPPGFHFHGRFR